ncbi:MAG: ATP-dependent metallopeptidase FtsH/Yme1/Tma family protein [Deltaproteobacteria bacterium]|nr:ATP-dependent metallopeptidase FtsH/Yme1/Tma family protein [Deltaproteobacteria bacterium]
MRQSHKTLALWVILILMFLAIYQIISQEQTPNEQPEFSKFLQHLEDGNVKKVKITLSGNGNAGTFEGKLVDERSFKTTGILTDKVLENLEKHKSTTFEVVPKAEGGLWQSLLITWLPMVFLVGIFFFFMKQLQSGGGKAMSFGKSKAKLMNENQNKVTFSDVAGVEEAKDDVQEIIEFLRDPKRFTRLGGRIPKGVLLMGPPGTGKTLIARAIAGEASVPFFSISGSDFVEMFVGVGASRVRDLFEQGKKNAPCIIFIDEIDAVGRHRGAGLGGGHDEREQTLNQLLVEMDGFESNEGVILIAATNRPDVLDPALLRPGRFDRRIVVPRPDVRGREGILQVHAKRTPLDTSVDLEVIARGTPGFAGADLENLVNEAALLAAHASRDKVTMEDFEHAKDKVLMGAERKTMVMTEEEQRNTAVHEAAHALVARAIPGTDPIHKVSIIPRGRALGLTQQLPTDDKYSMNRNGVLSDIAVLMGGRAGEDIVFGQFTTGAGNDIERATELARKMVCEWGMSDRLGPVAFGKREEQIFLGREMATHADYSEQTAIEIDSEIRRIITEQYERCRNILTEKRDALDRISEALFEYESLSGEEVDQLIRGEAIDREKPEQRHLKTPEQHRDRRRKDREASERKEQRGKGLLDTFPSAPEPGEAKA